jgi:hypothetical protein
MGVAGVNAIWGPETHALAPCKGREKGMADPRDRDRMVFETSEVVKRAIRMRAGMDGCKPADVINAALKSYLDKEIELVEQRLKEAGQLPVEETQKPGRRKKEGNA